MSEERDGNGQGSDAGQRGPTPGWYPDPSGRHSARWWDGQTWTNDVRDQPPPTPAQAGQPTEGPSGQPGSDAGQRGPTPGWYPDPSGRHSARWWDGQTWTNDVRDQPPPTPAHVPQRSSSSLGNNRVMIVAVSAVVVVFGVAALALLGDRASGPAAGTCVDLDPRWGSAADTYLSNVEEGWIREVDCSEPHNAEVLHTISGSEAEREGIFSRGDAQDYCIETHFESYVGIPWRDSRIEVAADYLGPDDLEVTRAEPWVCLLWSGNEFDVRTEPLRGSRL